MSYAEYSTPHHQTRFSAEFFNTITLADVEGLFQNDVLPHVLPRDSVTKWNLDRTVPSAIAEIVVAAGEEIPCYHDLRPIFEILEKAFYDEFLRRRHELCVPSNWKTTNCAIPFLQGAMSQLRLIVNYNNHEYNLLVAKRLLDRVHDSNLLSPNLIAELKLNRFAEPLAGFKVTETPLYTLGSLLDERWVLEDVLNARAEFLYFRRAVHFQHQDAEPSFLFLPTSFFNDGRTLMNKADAPYSAEIIAMRERIRSGGVDSLGFISWTADHYSAICKIFIADFEHGDSLQRSPAEDILDILRWAFSGLGHFAPPPQQKSIKAGPIDLQSIYAGMGSCGIAATNFIETQMGLGIPCWQASNSASFRDSCLQDLLLYHLITYVDWVQAQELAWAMSSPWIPTLLRFEDRLTPKPPPVKRGKPGKQKRQSRPRAPPKPKAAPVLIPKPTPIHLCDSSVRERTLLTYIIKYTQDFTVGPLDYCGIARRIKGRGGDLIMYCKGDPRLQTFYHRRHALSVATAKLKSKGEEKKGLSAKVLAAVERKVVKIKVDVGSDAQKENEPTSDCAPKKRRRSADRDLTVMVLSPRKRRKIACIE
ncbi:hypothetical protein R3P38DRAFT_3263915 [Favolaschia claudopus]|uniref:Uncharacterized protein n=2 Tax=Favolaschia claudopus TaxID=2862362 RepID=A0AAW0C4L1_9AGAR